MSDKAICCIMSVTNKLFQSHTLLLSGCLIPSGVFLGWCCLIPSGVFLFNSAWGPGAHYLANIAWQPRLIRMLLGGLLPDVPSKRGLATSEAITQIINKIPLKPL